MAKNWGDLGWKNDKGQKYEENVKNTLFNCKIYNFTGDN